MIMESEGEGERESHRSTSAGKLTDAINFYHLPFFSVRLAVDFRSADCCWSLLTSHFHLAGQRVQAIAGGLSTNFTEEDVHSSAGWWYSSSAPSRALFFAVFCFLASDKKK